MTPHFQRNFSDYEVPKHCEITFVPFTLPDGNQFSLETLKNPDLGIVFGKIRDSCQFFFAILGWAGFSLYISKYAADGGANFNQETLKALSLVRHVDFGGIENAVAILKEIDPASAIALADNIMQRQRMNVQM